MTRGADPVPAIVRDMTEEDAEAEVLATIYDRVTNNPGLGPSGSRIQLVAFECPACGYDRMLRKWGVHPEEQDRMTYHCQKPTCPHHHKDLYGFTQSHRASKPRVTD